MSTEVGKLGLRINFDADWGVGAGGGRHGSLDRVVRTDDLGLPMVPAKTMTGILRDAAEQGAFGLDGGTTGAPGRCGCSGCLGPTRLRGRLML